MKGGRIRKSLQTYLPLTPTASLMAETLYLNNYEVDLILRSYLLIWMNEQQTNYIPCSKLLYYFPTPCHGFIRKFFFDSI